MRPADVALKVSALDANRPTDFTADATQTAGVTTEPAAPGGNCAGAAVLISDLAKTQKFGFAEHGGTVRRFDAVNISHPRIKTGRPWRK